MKNSREILPYATELQAYTSLPRTCYTRRGATVADSSSHLTRIARSRSWLDVTHRLSHVHLISLLSYFVLRQSVGGHGKSPGSRQKPSQIYRLDTLCIADKLGFQYKTLNID